MLSGNDPQYRGTALIRKRTPLGPYRRPMPRTLGESQGGWAFFHRRGTPVNARINRSNCSTNVVSKRALRQESSQDT